MSTNKKAIEEALEKAKSSTDLDLPENLSDKSIKTRWKNEDLFDIGFVAVPTHFLELYSSMNITTGEAMFILQLMNFKWGEKDPFPGYALIAQRMGISDKVARRHAASLVAKKYLVRHIRFGKTNRFDLTKFFDALLETKRKIGRKPFKQKGGQK